MARRDLKEACVREALKIIESKGVEELSLRQVARRLKVSHQAPYKHFPSKDHLLAEIIGRGFDTFAEYLQREKTTRNPRRNLRLLGKAYLRFALDYSLYYRLMFASPHPDPKEHAEMARRSHGTFLILRGRVEAIAEATGAKMNIDMEALYIWSTMHGLASILAWEHTNGLPMKGDRRRQINHVLNRIGDGLAAAVEAGLPRRHAHTSARG